MDGPDDNICDNGLFGTETKRQTVCFLQPFVGTFFFPCTFVLFEKLFLTILPNMANSIVNTAKREIVATNKISFALVHGSRKAVPFMASVPSRELIVSQLICAYSFSILTNIA